MPGRRQPRRQLTGSRRPSLTTARRRKYVDRPPTFLLVVAVIYYCVVLPVNRLHQRFAPMQEPEAATKDCPECLSTIPAAARRCSSCTMPVTPTADRPRP